MSDPGAKKIATALVGVRGKSIERVFVVHHDDNRFQLYLVFSDATYYEFYGTGGVSGARCIDRDSLSAVREMIERRGGDIVEIGGAPSRGA